jgi:hypothetical protein
MRSAAVLLVWSPYSVICWAFNVNTASYRGMRSLEDNTALVYQGSGPI